MLLFLLKREVNIIERMHIHLVQKTSTKYTFYVNFFLIYNQYLKNLPL